MKRHLRTGFTTGATAAAAAKAAVVFLLEGRMPAEVSVALLTGGRIAIPIHSCRRTGDGAACTAIKDAGDDPDVTHGAEIGARVRLDDPAGCGGGRPEIIISGGDGVGRITKPGLELPPGEPAINPGPRRMIAQAVGEALSAHAAARTVAVEIFVPRGVEIARKTLNARLGIVGGISILGTTGVVRPMSHDAFTATIAAGLCAASDSHSGSGRNGRRKASCRSAISFKRAWSSPPKRDLRRRFWRSSSARPSKWLRVRRIRMRRDRS